MVRAVIQRVSQASVTVDGKVLSSIGRGIMVLVGIGTRDTAFELDWLAGKLLNMRLFPDAESDSWGWKKSVMDINGDVLCVSQFTLCANVRKGSKPDFHGAMAAETSKRMYHDFLERLSESYEKERIFDGEFGAMMSCALVNEGPATILLDSATDAPEPPKPKMSFQEKQALKAARRQEASSASPSRSSTPIESRTESPKDPETAADKLTERFKAAMMENY